MSRGKQYVKKGVWYMGGKKEDKKEGAIPFGSLLSIATPVLDEVAKPIRGKIFGRGRR